VSVKMDKWLILCVVVLCGLVWSLGPLGLLWFGILHGKDLSLIEANFRGVTCYCRRTKVFALTCTSIDNVFVVVNINFLQRILISHVVI